MTRCERSAAAVFGTNRGLPDGQAEALAVPHADSSLCAIPEGVGPEQAVLLTDILPTGYLGARGAEIEPGQDVAVIGCGPAGLMAILCAGLFGPARIFALDSVPERLAAAGRLGAIACDVSGDAQIRVMEATGGTHHMGLSEGAAAYELFAARRDGVLRVLLDPTA